MATPSPEQESAPVNSEEAVTKPSAQPNANATVMRGPQISVKINVQLPDLSTASKQVEDLSADRVLMNTPRAEVQGYQLPVIGGIPLLAKLGQGGMGAVYFGIHPRLRQEVAVKVLPFALMAQNETLIERFYREAQVAAKVKSPHVVGVLDVNEDSGLFYLVMEYISGVSAHRYAGLGSGRNEGLAEDIALRICIAATEGLAAAHAEGIVHRDVKPDNILIPLSKDGQEYLIDKAKLSDLGLARNENADASLTGMQMSMGTPGYMSPEQAVDAKEARSPADVFSMGATLYALLCGRPPFSGKSFTQVVLDTVQKKHIGPENFRSDLSPATLQLIEVLLQKEPGARPQDGAALLVCFKEALAAVVNPSSRTPGLAPMRRASGVSAMPLQPTVPSGRGTEATVQSGAAPTLASAGTQPTLVSKPASINVPPSGMAGGSATRALNTQSPRAQPFTHLPQHHPESITAAPWFKPALYGGAALLLFLAAWIFWPKGKSDPFQAEREQLIATYKPAEHATGENLDRAIHALEDFTYTYNARNAADLEPVQALLGGLKLRKNALSERENRFNSLVAEGKAKLDGQPLQALARFEEAAQLGKADPEKDFPDLLAGMPQPLSKLREKAQQAKDALLGKLKPPEPPPAGQPPPRPNTAFTDAVKAAQDSERTGQFEKAVIEYEEALKIEGGAPNEREGAENSLKRLREDLRSIRTAEGLIREAETAAQENRFDDARRLYDTAKQATNNAKVLAKVEAGITNLGASERELRYQRSMDAGNRAKNDRAYGDAITFFKRALQEKPDDQDASDAIAESTRLMKDPANSMRNPPPNGQQPPPQQGPNGGPPDQQMPPPQQGPNGGPPPGPNGGPPGPNGGRPGPNGGRPPR